MIVGIGVDLVDIARFERTIERTPRLRERLFAPAEQVLPLRSMAARYAAKEALIKALGGSDGVHWIEIEITPEASGRPWFTLSGSTAAVVAERGITTLHLSMSHDAGLAAAYVVAEGASYPREGASYSREGASCSREGASYPREGASYSREGASYLREGASYSREGASEPADGATGSTS